MEAKGRPPDDASDGAGSAVDLLLPSLLAGIDTTAAETARTAGPALALLARAFPGRGADILAPLVERLAADRSREAVCRTLATVDEDQERLLREALVEAAGEAGARELYRLIRAAEPWDLDAVVGTDGDPLAYATEFRQLVRLDDTYDGAVDDRPDGDDPVEHLQRETDTDADDDGGPTPPTGGRPDGGQPSSATTKRRRIEQVARSDAFREIVHRSAFDDLEVVAPATERRYGTLVRVRARTGGTERGIAVRLLDAPGEEFAAAVADDLHSWARLTGEGVVTVADWGTVPRPWVATECVEGSVAGRDRPDPATALRQIRALTGALAQLHGQSVVHGGIDPRTVVYPAGGLDGRPRPMLDSVGLLNSYRRAADPTDYLDPRYAAPEYFDGQYGRLDHATDIYQLGMVAYRLCTGRHPFDGSFEEIRAGVLEGRPPAPSERVDALPAALDDVVAKATARQKLTRYETANGLHRDVTRICERVL